MSLSSPSEGKWGDPRSRKRMTIALAPRANEPVCRILRRRFARQAPYLDRPARRRRLQPDRDQPLYELHRAREAPPRFSRRAKQQVKHDCHPLFLRPASGIQNILGAKTAPQPFQHLFIAIVGAKVDSGASCFAHGLGKFARERSGRAVGIPTQPAAKAAAGDLPAHLQSMPRWKIKFRVTGVEVVDALFQQPFQFVGNRSRRSVRVALLWQSDRRNRCTGRDSRAWFQIRPVRHADNSAHCPPTSGSLAEARPEASLRADCVAMPRCTAR